MTTSTTFSQTKLCLVIIHPLPWQRFFVTSQYCFHSISFCKLLTPRFGGLFNRHFVTCVNAVNIFLTIKKPTHHPFLLCFCLLLLSDKQVVFVSTHLSETGNLACIFNPVILLVDLLIKRLSNHSSVVVFSQCNKLPVKN